MYSQKFEAVGSIQESDIGKLLSDLLEARSYLDAQTFDVWLEEFLQDAICDLRRH